VSAQGLLFGFPGNKYGETVLVYMIKQVSRNRGKTHAYSAVVAAAVAASIAACGRDDVREGREKNMRPAVERTLPQRLEGREKTKHEKPHVQRIIGGDRHSTRHDTPDDPFGPLTPQRPREKRKWSNWSETELDSVTPHVDKLIQFSRENKGGERKVVGELNKQLGITRDIIGIVEKNTAGKFDKEKNKPVFLIATELVKRLGSQNPEEVAAARRILTVMGDDAFDVLSSAASHHDKDEIRLGALKTITEMISTGELSDITVNEYKFSEELHKRMFEDGNINVRAQAAVCAERLLEWMPNEEYSYLVKSRGELRTDLIKFGEQLQKDDFKDVKGDFNGARESFRDAWDRFNLQKTGDEPVTPKTFPDGIPGVSMKWAVKVQNPAGTIFHLRDIHARHVYTAAIVAEENMKSAVDAEDRALWLGRLEKALKLFENVEKSNRNAYRALIFLAERGVGDVASEGLCAGEEVKVRRDMFMSPVRSDEIDDESILVSVPEVYAEYTDPKIHLHPGDDKESSLKQLEAVRAKMPKESKGYKAIETERERKSLEAAFAHKRKDKPNFVLRYGGGHSFAEEVKDKYPGYNLVELTPKGYVEDIDLE